LTHQAATAPVGTPPYVTANDAGDGDSGGNNLMNFPVIYSATVSGGNVTIIGESRPGATVEFFEADADASGYGEGQAFVGSAVEGSGADTNGAIGSVDATARQFTFIFSVGSLISGDPVTATATDSSGNTSEFSLNVAAASSDFVVNHTGDGADANTGDGICQTATPGQCTLRAAIQQANATAGANAIAFGIPGGGPYTIQLASALPD
jgi:CSLREA domain-containing protein